MLQIKLLITFGISFMKALIRKRTSTFSLGILGILVWPTTSLLAQQAEVLGFIKDPTGHAVTGAKITIRNRATNAQQTAASNESGVEKLA